MDIRPPTFRSIKLVSDTGYSVTMAENANDYCLDESGLDWGTVGSTQNSTQYIDLIGKHVDSIVLSPRDITLVGWIIGESEATIQKRKITLNRVVNPMYNVRLEYKDYVLNFYPDSSIQYSKTYEENNEYMCKFQIQGTAPMPLFKLKDYDIYRQTTEVRSSFHFPLAIPKDRGVVFGYLPFDSIRNMPNTGDVESGFILYFSATGGQVVNPKITKLATNEIIQLNYTLEDGDSAEICTELGEQYVTIHTDSGRDLNGIKYLSNDSVIDMKLNVGINTFEPASEEGEAYLEASMRFSPRFLEVEGR